MNRRLAVKSLIIFSGSILILPGCTNSPKAASVWFDNIKINASQELLLLELSEMILPSNESPGAKDLELHLFVLKMVNDCYPEAERENFVSGLLALESHIKSQFNTDFDKLNASDRNQILKDLESKAIGLKMSEFYSITKRELIRGYKNSEFFMTKVKVYELVPGRYNGFLKVNPAKA